MKTPKLLDQVVSRVRNPTRSDISVLPDAPNALLLHDASSSPRDDWLPWLGNQLQWRGYDVAAPQLPDSDRPDLDRWWQLLRSFDFNDRTMIIGHGAGATMALGVLQRLPSRKHVHLVVCVSGSYRDDGRGCEGLFTEEYDWQKIRSQADDIALLWSPDDPYVSEEQTTVLSEKLDIDPVVIDGLGHFDLDVGPQYYRFPELIELIDDYK